MGQNKLNVKVNWKHAAIEKNIRLLEVAQDISRSAIFEREIEAASRETDWRAVQASLANLRRDESASVPTSFQANYSEHTAGLIQEIRAKILEQLGMKVLQNSYFLLLLHANYLLFLERQREEAVVTYPVPAGADSAGGSGEAVTDAASLAVITWNLHNQGGIEPRDIPGFVVEEIVRSRADIAVLTEFPTYEPIRYEFSQRMANSGYRLYASANRAGGNDTAIAVRSCHSVVYAAWQASHGFDYVPDNLMLQVKIHGITLCILGARIKDVTSYRHSPKQVDIIQAQKRCSEFQALLSWAATDHPVLIAGDFNTYREGTVVKQWNSQIMEKLAAQRGFSVVCPAQGSSLFAECGVHAFRPDRFVVRGLTLVGEPVYDRSFVTHAPHIYSGDLVGIIPGFPDHAILRAEFRLEK